MPLQFIYLSTNHRWYVEEGCSHHDVICFRDCWNLSLGFFLCCIGPGGCCFIQTNSRSYFALLVAFLVYPNFSILEHCVLKFYYFCTLIKDSFNFQNDFHGTSFVNSFSKSTNCSLIVVFPILVEGLTSHLPRLPPDPQSDTQTLCDSSQVTC